MLKSVLLFCALLLFSCRQDEPKAPLVPARLSEVYLDVLQARTTSSDSDTVTAKIDEVLARHNVSDSLLQASLKYYEDRPEAWLSILDSVIDSLEAEKKLQRKPESKPSPSPFQPPETK